MEGEIEFLRMLKTTCRSVRGGSRLEMVGPASEWEQRINARLSELGEDVDRHNGSRRRRRSPQPAAETPAPEPAPQAA